MNDDKTTFVVKGEKDISLVTQLLLHKGVRFFVDPWTLADDEWHVTVDSWQSQWLRALGYYEYDPYESG